MKQRFSYLDLRLIVSEIATELGDARLQNVYTLESSSRQFLFKFDGTSSGNKQFLLIDPGQRLHITKFQHQPATMPSYFVQKLRRTLQNRRVSGFRVVEGTRTAVMSLSNHTLHVVFELFSGGNIMIVENGQITALLRTAKPEYEIGAPYDVHQTNSAGQKSVIDTESLVAACTGNQLVRAIGPFATDASASLLVTCLRAHNLDPKAKLSSQEALEKLELIQQSVKQALLWAERLVKSVPPHVGYIFRDKDGPLEFEPFKEYFDAEIELKKESQGDSAVQYSVEKLESYNETVDVFFGKVWTERQGSREDALYAQAEQRRQLVRSEQQTRLEALKAEEEKHEQLGSLIEIHSDLVGKAILAVSSLQQQGFDWGDAQKLIDIEKQKGNDVAECIDSLQLEKQQAILVLDGVKVPVNVQISAFANAREYFDRRREAQDRLAKTEKHIAGALKSAEVRISRDLERNLEQQRKQAESSALKKVRSVYWFEKFYWFLTSQNQLAVAGKDAMQNELLLTRYFDNNDLCVFQHGSDSSILLLKGGGGPQSLVQAANFVSVTNPGNWETKSRGNCYYLSRSQVPKSSRPGEPVTVNFMKQLPNQTAVQPTSLDMGMALLWQTEEEYADSDGEDEFDAEEEFPEIEFDSDIDAFSSDEESPNTQTEDLVESEKFEEPENSVEPEESEESVEPEETEESVEPEEPEEPSDYSELSQRSSPAVENDQLNTVKPKLKVRGQKKKLRKYLNQDEEDRERAMQRLGTLKGLERQKQAEKEKIESKQKEQQQKAEREARRKLKDLSFLDKPEPQPFPSTLINSWSSDKNIIAAVLMFAPWAALQSAQYKQKLVLGQLKKGKATNEILHVFGKELDELEIEASEASEQSEAQEETDKSIASEEVTQSNGRKTSPKKLLEAVRPVEVQNTIAVTKLQLANYGNASKGAKGGKGSKTSSTGSSKGNKSGAKNAANAKTGSKGSKGSKDSKGKGKTSKK